MTGPGGAAERGNAMAGTGSAASLTGTGGAADSVSGPGSLLYLNGAQASIAGSGNTLAMTGASASVGAGNADAFVFQAAFGQNTIAGFDASSSMQLAASDFANWGALQGSMAQVGANTAIALDASDSITLAGVAMGSLAQSQFSFK